jgi:hypothetical protein
MCAYNVRKSGKVDYDPATGTERTANRFMEVGILIFGGALMYFVYWLVRTFLF